jgi:DNA-binding MarR family transcriptional regulator
MTGGKVETLFLQEKPVEIILAAKKADKPMYVAKLARETDSTYAHTFRVVSKLEELGVITLRDEGRTKLVKLTEIGEAIASELLNLLSLLELIEIANAVEAIHEREIKGRLRGEINKEAVLSRLEQQAKKLEPLTREKPEIIIKLAKAQFKRIGEMSKEVKGLIVGQ